MTEPENTEELALTTDNAVVAEIEDDDSLIRPNINLPTRDDMTLQKVYQILKQNYDNFSFDVSEDYSTKFNSLDDLEDYTDRSLGDIRDEQYKTESLVRTRKGAAMARFWCICKVLSDIVANGKKYGDGAVQKYAAHKNISPAYIYQLRNIALRIDIQDAFLLGTRGIGSGALRKLAGFQDDVTRKTIIDTFLERYCDTVNKKERDIAKKAFSAAINSPNKNAKNIEAANPIVALANAEDFVATPEVEGVIAAITSVSSMLRKLARAEIMHDLQQYAGNFFLMDNVPDAEKQLAKVMEKAQELRKLLDDAQANIDEASTEIDSLLAVKLLPHEDVKNEATSAKSRK